MGLEGVVSKKRNAPYRSRADWVKVKTKAWRDANQYQAEQFSKRRKETV